MPTWICWHRTHRSSCRAAFAARVASSAIEIRGEVTLNLRRGASDDGGPPPSQFCTLTQEVLPVRPTSSNPLAALVTADPQILPVTVGAPGINSLTVADAARLICLLPASGAPASLFLRLSGSPDDVLIDACGNPPDSGLLAGRRRLVRGAGWGRARRGGDCRQAERRALEPGCDAARPRELPSADSALHHQVPARPQDQSQPHEVPDRCGGASPMV